MRKWIVTFFLLAASMAWAQDDSELRQIYMQAEEEYTIGHFDASIRLLNENIAGFDGALKTSAYRLLSLCYLGKDHVQDAEKYASLLLKEDPYYSTSIHDPLRFADMIERLKRGEETTITTASQQAESIEEAPVPVTLITEEMIKASGARTLADLLTLYVPGMSLVEGDEMNVAMHGVYSSSQEKILIMLDGHRLNSRTTNSEAPDYRTSLDKIKQIEVLRGPASSLYGNVALTAVVNIITKKGREVDGVQLSAGIGTNHTYRADFLMGKSGLGIDFLAWASVYTSQGEKRYVDVGDKDFYGKILRSGYMYIDGYNHQPAYDIGFSAQWNEFKFMFNTQHSKKVPSYNSVLFQGLYSYDKYRNMNGSKPGHTRKATHIDLSYGKSWRDNWHSKLNVYIDLENISNYDVGGDSILPADREKIPIRDNEILDNIDKTKIRQRGVYQVQSLRDYTYGAIMQTNYDFQKNIWKGSLLVGMQVESYTLKDCNMSVGDNFDRILVTYSNQNRFLLLGKEFNFSAFTQLKTNIGRYFIFNGGLRYDYKHRYNGKKLNVCSPRLSLIYHINSNVNLKLGYSHSFVDAPYLYRGSNTTTYPGGNNLGPEQLDAIQLTFNHSIPSLRLKYETNLYYNRLSDLIYLDYSIPTYYNSGGIDVIGIEEVVSYSNARSLAYLNMSYQWLLDNTNYAATGSYIHHIPKFRLGGMYRYQFLKDAKYGNAYARINATVYSKQISPIQSAYIGENVINDLEHELSPYAIFNAGADYLYKKVSLSANVYNLFNLKYYQGGARKAIPSPQQSISFLLKVSYKF